MVENLKSLCSEKDADIKSKDTEIAILKERNSELEAKLREEESLRRKLHNTVQELKVVFSLMYNINIILYCKYYICLKSLL